MTTTRCPRGRRRAEQRGRWLFWVVVTPLKFGGRGSTFPPWHFTLIITAARGRCGTPWPKVLASATNNICLWPSATV
ncbi:hypothetical protein niasHT_023089 [Heterodera trifolii]|uniref:Uncharacterized protein n=1 Tax=Heterodera trifolii TaxID=157864 RepID=A0ABD2KFP7_9BILA